MIFQINPFKIERSNEKKERNCAKDCSAHCVHARSSLSSSLSIGKIRSKLLREVKFCKSATWVAKRAIQKLCRKMREVLFNDHIGHKRASL